MKITLMHPAIGEFSFPLEKSSKAFIGRRGPDLDVELTWDPRISRRHGAVWVEDGAVWYEDAGSRNGSWQGNARLSGKKRLERGESILIGETALIVPAEDGPDLREVEATHEAFDNDIVKEITAVLDLTAQVRTDDLRIGAPTPKQPEASRRARRILDNRRVELQLSGRDELRELWQRDISKGGLFVEMDEAPPPGTSLVVHLKTPGGKLDFNATVVHVVPPDRAKTYGIAPGAGLAFTDLNEQKKAAIRDYVDGIANALDGDLEKAAQVDDDDDLENVFEEVKRVLRHAEHDALYAALDLYPTATTDQISERISILFDRFERAAHTLPPPQSARVRAATTVLSRIRRVLGSDLSRLEYDFRSGHVRALERIARAKDESGVSLSTLRRAWNRVCPDRVDQAALLTRQAFAARQVQDVIAAIEHGRRALELNPFFEELRKTVETWEQFLRDERADGDLLRRTG
ncbi:MAG: PilZ domain-containing protein [Deltaproteobacteria bacterium]